MWRKIFLEENGKVSCLKQGNRWESKENTVNFGNLKSLQLMTCTIRYDMECGWVHAEDLCVIINFSKT